MISGTGALQGSSVEAKPLFRRKAARSETAFGLPRDFLDNRFVYVVISPRAQGLSVGVNFNPDKRCNFDCVYCEVDRSAPAAEEKLDVNVMAPELFRTLQLVCQGELHLIPRYSHLPRELLKLRHVALSGDGEPTFSEAFAEALQAVIHIRALGQLPFFKIVLITNAVGLDRPEVQHGLKFLTRQDEIWVKLDGGTQDYINKINRADVPLDKILANILMMAQQRPVVVQSLFPLYKEQEPLPSEIESYARQLLRLREQGAQISMVQIYSATRPSPHSDYGHLPLRTLSRIAQRVRDVAGLPTEVF